LGWRRWVYGIEMYMNVCPSFLLSLPSLSFSVTTTVAAPRLLSHSREKKVHTHIIAKSREKTEKKAGEEGQLYTSL
jgi:hypothetical protein